MQKPTRIKSTATCEKLDLQITGHCGASSKRFDSSFVLVTNYKAENLQEKPKEAEQCESVSRIEICKVEDTVSVSTETQSIFLFIQCSATFGNF